MKGRWVEWRPRLIEGLDADDSDTDTPVTLEGILVTVEDEAGADTCEA